MSNDDKNSQIDQANAYKEPPKKSVVALPRPNPGEKVTKGS